MKSPKEILKAMVCDAVDKMFKENIISCHAVHQIPKYLTITCKNKEFSSKYILAILSFLYGNNVKSFIFEDETMISHNINIPQKYLEPESSEPKEESTKIEQLKQIKEVIKLLMRFAASHSYDGYILDIKLKNKPPDMFAGYNITEIIENIDRWIEIEEEIYAPINERATSSHYVSEGNIEEVEHDDSVIDECKAHPIANDVFPEEWLDKYGFPKFNKIKTIIQQNQYEIGNLPLYLLGLFWRIDRLEGFQSHNSSKTLKLEKRLEKIEKCIEG